MTPLQSLKLAWVLMLLLVLTGCWDRLELNEISIVTGMAIDKGTHAKYQLTVEILNPAAIDPKQASQESGSITYQLQGQSIAELTSKMNVGFSRTLEFSHMRLLVISKEIAQHSLLEFMDFMERDRQIRNDFNIIIAKEGPAADILKVNYPLQKVSSLKLSQQLQTMFEQWGGDPDVHVRDLINAVSSEGREPVMAIVTIQGEPSKGKKQDNMTSIEPDAMVNLDGLAIFKDLRYIGSLTLEDTRNLLWIQDKIKNTSFVFACAENLYGTVKINKSRTTIDASFKQGRPRIKINISVEARLDAYQCKDLALDKFETFHKLEKQLSQNIEQQVLSTVTTVQKKFKSDIFGFGEQLMRQDYPSFMQIKSNWNEQFVDAEIRVQVQAKIRRSGLIINPYLQTEQ